MQRRREKRNHLLPPFLLSVLVLADRDNISLCSCGICIYSNIHQLEKIFVNGKNEKGEWIDPAHKIGIKTCICGPPWSKWCGINWINAASQKREILHKPL